MSTHIVKSVIFVLISGIIAMVYAQDNFSDSSLSNIELLGKYVFFDENLSRPQRMGCVTCHDPENGGSGKDLLGSLVNLGPVVIRGANPFKVGNMKPPTNAYASHIPPFQFCGHGGLAIAGFQDVCGGNFWNGRAEGNEFADVVFPSGATEHIGEEIFYAANGVEIPNISNYAVYFGPTADQALKPMPNPIEQNISRQAVCRQVALSAYAPLYKKTWQVPIDCRDVPVAVSNPDATPPDKAYDISFKRLMLAVCAWQDSKDLNSFSSKRDKALAADADKKFPLDGLTPQENRGHDLFYATRFSRLPDGKFANCAFCHSDNPVLPGPGIKDDGTEPFQLYSAQDYHNIGTPRNPQIPPSYDDNGNLIDTDLGLAGHAPGYPPGFFKVPTLRNVDKRKHPLFIKSYTHNGWFKSLSSLVHFYNTAAVNGATATKFGVKSCGPGIETEKDALANNCWPAPAYGGGAIPFLVGDLNLTKEDEDAIVAYLKTLNDEHTAVAPKPYIK